MDPAQDTLHRLPLPSFHVAPFRPSFRNSKEGKRERRDSHDIAHSAANRPKRTNAPPASSDNRDEATDLIGPHQGKSDKSGPMFRGLAHTGRLLRTIHRLL